MDVEHMYGRTVELSTGAEIQARGPVAAVRVFDDVVCVLLAWRLDRGRRSIARIRVNNAYGYDPMGRLLWRVRSLPHDDLGNVFTAFVDEVPGFMLHEARGWHMALAPSTGRIVRLDRVT